MSYHTVEINGVEVPVPKDYDRFQQKVERDYSKRIIRVPYPGTFTFVGAGYSALRALFLEDICSSASFAAYDNCGTTRYTTIRGEIKVADCKWNLRDCSVETSVEDDTIGARIVNNFRIPVSPTSPKTKNGEDITPVAQLDIEVFDPSDPVTDYLADTRAMFDWMACMEHAIGYLSDGAVGVQSTWYDNLPTTEKIALCGGFQLRTASNAEEDIRITYVFEKLWLEVAKRYNLWMCVARDNQGNPIVLIEHEDDMFSSTTAFELPWVDGLVQTIDTDRLYSSVAVGDEKGIPNWGDVESLPYLVLQGFSEQRYHFAGQCNLDVVLELTGEWITDSNVIERVLVLATADTEYDKDIFIVQYTGYNSKATKGDYLNPSTNPYLYNEALLCINILNRYDLPSDVGQYYDSQDAVFRASHPALYSATSQLVQPAAVGDTFEYLYPAGYIVFPDDVTPPNQDPSGLWDGLNRYTAPAQGYYEFGWYFPWVSAHVTPTGHAPAQAFVIAEIQRFDSGNNFISGVRATSDPRTATGTSIFTGSLGLVMNTGDYAVITFIRLVRRIGPGSATVSITPQAGSAVFTTFVAAGGGVITSVDPLSPRVVRYEFDRLIPIEQWQQVINDPRLAIGISHESGPMRVGHILEASREVVRGRTSFTLLTTKRQPL